MKKRHSWDRLYIANPLAKAFASSYQARYNEAPDYIAVYGYTIGQYLVGAVRRADGDPVRLRNELAALDIKESVRGPLRMTKGRDVYCPIGIYERKGTQSVLLKSIDFTE